MAPQDTTAAKPSQPAGIRRDDNSAAPGHPTRMASDASGINPEDRAPIHPSMPHLPPA